MITQDELKKRSEELEKKLISCSICPRKCGNNRIEDKKGYCHSGYLPIVASYSPHFGEEPVLVGQGGSGTIFLGNCNLRCVFCQNSQISQQYKAMQTHEMSFENMADIMIYLQKKGCENIKCVPKCHSSTFFDPR